MTKARTLATWLLIALGTATALTACENTIRGVGQDVEETGDAVEDSVE
ncbi:MAG: entericidin A/B family lipoprotein [Azospirillaceae bacterium]